MSRDEYWHGNDVRVLREYIKADRYRQERQNNEAWLQGMYFFDALSTALANFGLKKGTPPRKYAEKPYDLGIREKTAAEKKREVEAKRMKAYLYFDGLIKKQNAREGE